MSQNKPSGKTRNRKPKSPWQRALSAFETNPRWTIGLILVALNVPIGFVTFIVGLSLPNPQLPAWPLWFARISMIIVVAMAANYAFLAWRAGRGRNGAGRSIVDKFKARPAHTAVMVLAGCLILCGTLGILYYLVLMPNFVPSPALRGFAFNSSTVVTVLGVYLMVQAWIDERKAQAKRTLDARGVGRAALLLVGGPVVIAFMWMIFLNGLASFAMHLLSPRETRWVTEQVASSGGSGVRDITCGGVWEAELHDDTWWWRRRVCGIDRADMYALKQGGVIHLYGSVSRFGVYVDSYRLR